VELDKARELFSDRFNQTTREANLIHEVWNSFANWRAFMGDFPEFKGHFASGRALDLGAAPKHEGEPIILIASGPSFDKYIERLKKWPFDIMCSTSHAATLVYHGIKPTYVLALDFRSNWGEMDADHWEDDIPLITTPGVMPDLIHNWPGKYFLFRQNVHTSPFYGNAQRLAYSDRVLDWNENRWQFNFKINTEITMFGCSPACQLFAADMMGYNPVYLVGADFAFKDDDHYRFRRWGWNEEEKWHEYPMTPGSVVAKAPDGGGEDGSRGSSSRIDWVQGDLKSNRQLFFYKKNMLSSVRLAQLKQHRKILLIDEENDSLITELPKVKFSDVMELEIARKTLRDLKAEYKEGDDRRSLDDQTAKIKILSKKVKALPRKKYIDVIEEYLADLHTYVIETTSGLIYVESVNPKDEILRFISQIDSSYICRRCNAKINLWNPKYPTASMSTNDKKCGRCGEDAVEKEATLDKEKNINRISALFDKLHGEKKLDPVAHSMVVNE